MRWLRLVGLVVLLAVPVVAAQTSAPAPAAAGKGVIRGVVTAADTGRPIRGADIRVSGGAIPFSEPRWVRSDDQGRYEVAGLAPGRYTLTASKLGYLSLGYGQIRPGESPRPVEVTDGVPVTGMNFALPRGSVIVVRLTDEFGEPVQGMLVRALTSRFMFGQRSLQPVQGSSNVTDDRGEIRIYGLPPGEYYVGTDPTISMAHRNGTTTFHPGTVRAEEAQPVRLDIDQEVVVTFPIVRVRPARLSGIVLGSNGAPLANARASLPRTGLGSGSMPQLRLGPDGTFDERDLAAGNYAIEVREPEWALHHVRIEGADITSLVITTRKPTTVRGRITFEDAAPPDQPISVRATFVGIPPMAALSPGSFRSRDGVSAVRVEPADEWKFEAQVAGDGVLRLAPPSSNTWVLKAVLLDGRDVTETPLDFAAYEGKAVEIVLRARGATITGTVTDLRGQTTRDYVVVIFPEDSAASPAVSRMIAAARPDQEGRFTLGSLPSGRYLITAIEYLQAGEERDPELLRQLRARATPLTLSEGESRAMTLRLEP